MSAPGSVQAVWLGAWLLQNQFHGLGNPTWLQRCVEPRVNVVDALAHKQPKLTGDCRAVWAQLLVAAAGRAGVQGDAGPAAGALQVVDLVSHLPHLRGIKQRTKRQFKTLRRTQPVQGP